MVLTGQNNDVLDDLAIMADELKLNFDTWDLNEVYQNVNSNNLLKKIEALRILVIKSGMEKAPDSDMFCVLTELINHKNKILRVAAHELCYYLMGSYKDEIQEIAKQQAITDPELAENWKYIAELKV